MDIRKWPSLATLVSHRGQCVLGLLAHGVLLYCMTVQCDKHEIATLGMLDLYPPIGEVSMKENCCHNQQPTRATV